MHHSVHNDGLRLLSRPHRVVWAGWEADTQRLQQGGWSIAAEQDILRKGIRLVMRHEPLKLYAITSYVADMHWEAIQNPYAHGVELTFHVVQAGSRMEISIIESSFDFKAIDAQPQMTTKHVRDIDDMNIFQVPLKRTEEIFIEEADMEVIDHLMAIKELQAPKQAELRKRAINSATVEEGCYLPEVAPEQNMLAQIIQFPGSRVA